MANRETVQKEIEAKIAQGEVTVAKLKEKMSEAGDDAGKDMSDALAKSEDLLNKARSKMRELADASDEEFEEAWNSAKETWHSLSNDMERGWADLGDRIKKFFS